MRDEAIDLCGQVDFTRTDAMPLLERDAQFHFACAGCGNCCRGWEDIVLSGYDSSVLVKETPSGCCAVAVVV